MARGRTYQLNGYQGLWVRERKHDKAYELKLDGVSLTLHGVTTEKEAIARWKQATLRKDQTGENALPTPTKFEVLADEFFEDWDRKVAVGLRSARTGLTYVSAYNLHIAPFFADVLVHRIGSEDIVDYISDRREDGAADFTINGEISVIRNVLKKGRRRKPKALFHDPFADLKGENELPVQQPRKSWVRRVLRPDELEKLFNAMSDDLDLLELAVTIAFCGFRRNEACGLLWNCVDLVDGVVHLDLQLAPPERGGRPTRVELKNKKARDVILLPRVQEVLIRKLQIERERGLGDLEHFVFSDLARPGIPVDPNRVTKAIKAAAKRAGIHGEIGPQVLRRSAASIWASAGVQREVGAQMLGHAPEVWDANYVTPFRDAAEREETRARLLRVGFGQLLDQGTAA